ncbi:MAG: transporter substrate-binding domain-containing protein [Desulfobacula sp.]|nr:transporter substrate-binding domain-containing protein [Desulfobacula sp.]
MNIHEFKKRPKLKISMSRYQIWMIAVFFSICFSASVLADQNVLNVKVGAYENYPKIYKNENGTISGFWPDLLNYIAKNEDWKIQYIHGTWKQGLESLKRKNIDILPDVAFTPERNKLYVFSQTPVLMSWSRIYVRENNKDIYGLTDLENKRIGALEQSVNLEGEGGLKEILGKFDIKSKFFEYSSYDEVFKALENGEIDAGVTNRNFGNKNADDYQVKKTSIIFQPININFAFPQNYYLTTQLSKKIDTIIQKLKSNDNSVYYKLLEKYIEGEIVQKRTEILPGWFKLFLVGIGILILIFLLVLSISRYQIRKKTQEILAKNKEIFKGEQQYQEIYNATSDSISIHDIKTGKVLEANQATLEMFGYTREEIFHLNVGDLFSQKYAKTSDHLPIVFKEVFEQGPRVFEWLAKRKSGEFVWVEVGLKHTLIREKGAIIAVTRDINQRKESAKDLAQEKERLAVTLRSIGDAVITIDMDGNVELINRVAEKLTGWTREEALGRPVSSIFNLIYGQTGDRIENPIEMILKAGKIINLATQTLLVAKDGVQYSIAHCGALIRDKKEKTSGVVLVFRDISEEIKMEKELLKIKKLESLGVLAGGIAHDFNNILSAILGNINVANISVDPKSQVFRLLKNTEKAVVRATNLTKQLLIFSKGGDPVREITSIKHLIKESADFVLHGSNVACTYECKNDLWLVKIDSGQISQVIQNLIINASQAMPGGGNIDIHCFNVPDVNKENPNIFLAGPHIKIVIQDSGTGIPQSIIDKIFDPFFTTKAKGSGLGLATTHSIVKKHNGQITVVSEPNKGTKFTLFLPATMEKQKIAEQKAAQVSIPGHLKILVMDDDDMVLSTASNMLSHIGCESILVKDGENALNTYTDFFNQGTPFDLVIMDLTIPGGMGGVKAAKKIHQLNPNAKIIVASGYSNDSVISRYKDYGFCASISKPYGMDDLVRTINSVIKAS